MMMGNERFSFPFVGVSSVLSIIQRGERRETGREERQTEKRDDINIIWAR